MMTITNQFLLAAGLVGALFMANTATLCAGELKSGVEVGGSIASYQTTKCGGIDDGVKTGQSLCYT
jgi:hypothetical protein